MTNLRHRLLRPYLIVIAALFSVPVLGYVDYLTGPELSFEFIYLAPVCVVAWFVGRWPGFGMVAAVSLTRLVVDYFEPNTSGNILLWHQVNCYVFFIVIVYLQSGLKFERETLDKRVKERTVDLQQLAVQLSEVEETSRRGLAIELHDSISQILSLLKLKLGMLAQQKGGFVRCDDLADPLHMLDDSIAQARTLMFELYPSTLDDLGLLATLRTYGEHLHSDLGVQVTLSEFGQPQTLPAAKLGYLYRTCKELMSNAIKHGAAKNIVVAFRWLPDVLRITVDDDGCGFGATLPLGTTSPDQQETAKAGETVLKPKGFGLRSIRERIDSLGGLAHFDSEPGRGTRVVLELPLAATESG